MIIVSKNDKHEVENIIEKLNLNIKNYKFKF